MKHLMLNVKLKGLGESIMFSIEEIYNEAIRISRNIVEDIRFGRKLYLEPVNMCAVQFCKHFDDDTNIISFLNSIQGKYPYLYSHPVNVALFSFVIGKWLNLDNEKLENLVRTGLLHDIGKAKIKDSLLNKSETLSIEEIERLKTHPVIGYRLIDSVKSFEPEVLRGVLFHHERMDGTGYPLGLKGEQINLISKIIAIADTYDAITTSRPYGQKKSPLKAIEEIQANSLNHLDQYISQIFVNKIIEFYNGREIKLSNEQIGVIVYINPIDITKPLVRCEEVYHDLAVERDIEIVEIL